MKMRIAVLFLFVFAAGCSAAWERSNVTGTQLVADTDACKVAATGGRLCCRRERRYGEATHDEPDPRCGRAG